MKEICLEDQETIREFLVESHENLGRLDQDLIKLEKEPNDVSLLSSVFRTIHTIKGACGFLAFSNLEKMTHQAETLLSQLRDGKRELNVQLISLILETVDATRKVLSAIEETGNEGDFHFADLTERLRASVEIDTRSKDAQGKTPNAVSEPLVSPQTDSRFSVSVDTLNDSEAATPAQAEVPWFGVERRRSARAKIEAEEVARTASAADANIRVAVGLLDKLMDLVGELVLTRNQILQFTADRDDLTLNATSQRLNLITSELQEGVMKTRMQPIGSTWQNLPRVVRDMAISLNKQIEIKMNGADTELDRTIIEAIKDPLIHLVRNSCDHGIELPDVRVAAGKQPQGTMTLNAYHEGGQVNIEVCDDGGGINLAKVREKAVASGIVRPEELMRLSEPDTLNLIFKPGFSTATQVTNISGRGVGMDVVKANVEKIGGVVDVINRPGIGSTIKIRIPLTLAIIPGLVIASGGERFVIPQVSLLELIRLEADGSGKHIEDVHGTPVYRRRGSLLPVTYLNDVLGLESAAPDQAINMVVLQAEGRQFGLVVDGISDTQEIVVKPLSKQLKGLTLYAGATIMGDGFVALILDVLGVGQRSGVFGHSQEVSRNSGYPDVEEPVEQQSFLLFRAGSFDRLAVPLSLVARLEEFPLSSIERAGGGHVAQYRERILPLVSLRSVLEPDAPEHPASANPIQVVVFNDQKHTIGMIVDQILDVAEEAVTVRQKANRRGLLGSAVIGGRVTDFLDLSEIMRCSEGKWIDSGRIPAADKTVLIADSSAFNRELIRAAIEMAGYPIREASTLDDALHILDTQKIDMIFVAVDLPPGRAAALGRELRRRPDCHTIPAFAIANSIEEAKSFDFQASSFQGCLAKIDIVSELDPIMRVLSSQPTVQRELLAPRRSA